MTDVSFFFNYLLLTPFPFPHRSQKFGEFVVIFHAYLYVYICFLWLKYCFFLLYLKSPYFPSNPKSSYYLLYVVSWWYIPRQLSTSYCFCHDIKWVWYFQYMRALSRQSLVHISSLASIISKLIPTSNYMLIVIFIVLSSTLCFQ